MYSLLDCFPCNGTGTYIIEYDEEEGVDLTEVCPYCDGIGFKVKNGN